MDMSRRHLPSRRQAGSGKSSAGLLQRFGTKRIVQGRTAEYYVVCQKRVRPHGRISALVCCSKRLEAKDMMASLRRCVSTIGGLVAAARCSAQGGGAEAHQCPSACEMYRTEDVRTHRSSGRRRVRLSRVRSCDGAEAMHT
eukprot:1486376-Prymnesium_polylepis.2